MIGTDAVRRVASRRLPDGRAVARKGQGNAERRTPNADLSAVAFGEGGWWENDRPMETTTWFGWWREAPGDAKRALFAAALGWMLDAFDVMLYALVLTAVMSDLGLSKATAGLIGSVTLVAAAVGGVVFGLVADRYGRTRALMASILLYSVFTALCGLAQSGLQLALFRIGLGLGMGGEWASGAALVAETWPDEHRGKALGLMQSAWAVGYALAAIVTSLVLPVWGWRAVFFVGVLPALFTVWIRRAVREPDLWRDSVRQSPRAGLAAVVADGRLGLTVALALMNACCLFAWWGFNSWIPAYLSLPPAQGGSGPRCARHGVAGRPDAGGDVVRLRDVRRRGRRVRPQADLRHVSADGGVAAGPVRAGQLDRWCCCCSDPSWPSSAPATSPGSGSSPRSRTRRPSAPPRRA